MKNIKGFVVGVVVGATLMSATSVLAKNETVNAIFYDMKLIVNGEKVQLSEKPIVRDGVSYLPVRNVGNMLGYDVKWDAQSATATLTERTIATPTPTPSATPANSGSVVSNMVDPYLVDGKINLDKVKAGIEGKKIKVNDTDATTGETLMIRAAKDDAYTVLHYLYNSGANVNLQDNEGKTPLHHAVIKENLSAIGELLDAFKADSTIKDKSGKTARDYTEKNSRIYRLINAYSG
jgi:hypothetical protein